MPKGKKISKNSKDPSDPTMLHDKKVMESKVQKDGPSKKKGGVQTQLSFPSKSSPTLEKRKRDTLVDESDAQMKKAKRQKTVMIDLSNDEETMVNDHHRRESRGNTTDDQMDTSDIDTDNRETSDKMDTGTMKNNKKIQKKSAKKSNVKKETDKKSEKKNHKASTTKDEKSRLPKGVKKETKENEDEYVEDDEELEDIVNSNAIQSSPSNMWADKYAPKSISQIIAHKTEIQVLDFWIKNFDAYFVHTSKKAIPKPTNLKSQKQKRLYFECKKYRSVLLSGIAGIGKTSAAHLVCKENGYDVLEWNASDVRSKIKIQKEISELTGNLTMESFISDSKKSINRPKERKVAIVLDEVDGMSSGDRSGIQEIIKLIKDTKVPIICICNDVRKRNIMTLTKHCLQLPFSRPRKDIVQKYIQKICNIEGFKIDSDILLQIIEALRNDIRCVLNNLQFMNLNRLDSSKNAETIRKGAEQLNVFQVADSIFHLHDDERTANNIMNRYFFDPSLIPLFIQENYINMRRSSWTQEERCERIQNAADWLSLGDVVESSLRKEQEWSLAPFHACCSTIAPTHYCHGGFEKLLPTDQHMIRFPSALGKGSTTRKNESIINLLKNNCSKLVSVSNSDITLEYIPMWNTHISSELCREPPRLGDVVSFMDAYGITRDDLESLSELHSLKDTLKLDLDFKRVSSQTKRKLTAAYKAASRQISVASLLRREKIGFSKESILDEEANQNEIFQDETKAPEDKSDEMDSTIVEKVDLSKLAKKIKKTSARGRKKR